MSINKSFCYGIIVASFTWTVTIYLYYTLNNNNVSTSTTSIDTKSSELNNYLPINQIEDDFPKKDKSKVLGKGEVYDKYEKHKKELKKKNYSQKLIDELKSVKIPVPLEKEEYGVIKNLEDQMIRDEGYKNHAFNALVSKNIGLFRDLPDTRHNL